MSFSSEHYAAKKKCGYRRRRVIDAVLLPEGKLAALGCESALNAGKRVGLARRDLRFPDLKNMFNKHCWLNRNISYESKSDMEDKSNINYGISKLSATT